jgi:uncharacterized protein YceH (UPF0502 family)
MALHELEDAGLAAPVRGTESRVAKFAHHIGEVFNLRRGELAVLCVLLLRGAQTPGELRSRTDRMHNFTTMEEVESTLQQLAQREPPLARAQPREPGAREMRYAHLLSPVADAASAKFTETSRSAAQRTEEGDEAVIERIATLESEVVQLRTRIASLEDKLAQLVG